MRLLILLDSETTRQPIEDALLRIRDDYAPATPVTWEYETRDFSTVHWIEYLPNFKGISIDLVKKNMSDIFIRDGEKWDNVIYVIDPIHWLEDHAWGWNLGTPIHGYAVELVRATHNPDWLYKTFAMEIAHSWNDIGIREIGDNLLSVFSVTDFDNMVIHGVDSRYGKNVPLNAPITGYYTDYNYRPIISMAQNQLMRMFQVRKDRYERGIYKYWRNLYVGKSGDDVAELQRRLIREGIMSHAATGYFGPITQDAVKLYQCQHGISPAIGYVGPITRLALNEGMIMTSAAVGSAIEAEPLLVEELQIWDNVK